MVGPFPKTPDSADHEAEGSSEGFYLRSQRVCTLKLTWTRVDHWSELPTQVAKALFRHSHKTNTLAKPTEESAAPNARDDSDSAGRTLSGRVRPGRLVSLIAEGGPAFMRSGGSRCCSCSSSRRLPLFL